MFAASALIEAGPRLRLLLLAAIAFELLSIVWYGLYAPFNISTGPRLLFTTAALGGQLALLGAIAVASGVRVGTPWTRVPDRASAAVRGQL